MLTMDNYRSDREILTPFPAVPPLPAWYGDDSIQQLKSRILESRQEAAMIDITAVLSVLLILCLGLLVCAGVVVEARRRYIKLRLDQRFCQLTRDALL